MIQTQKICIVQFGRIGDLILMTPMFKTIHDVNPDNQVHVLAGRNNYHFARNYPFIDQVHVYEKIPWQTIQFILSLKNEMFDIWIDPKDHYSIESFHFAKFANAKFKVGFDSKYTSLFDKQIPVDTKQKELHVIERNLNALALAGIQSDIKRPILFSDPQYDEDFEQFLSSQKIRTFACVNLSANMKARYWPEEKWQTFVHYLTQKVPHIMIICKPEDKDMANRLTALNDPCFYYPTRSVTEVFSVIQKALFLVTPDTAVIHMASAFNIPVVGLYANRPANIVKFHPLSDLYRVVVNRQSHVFIQDISVDAVLKAVDEIISEL